MCVWGGVGRDVRTQRTREEVVHVATFNSHRNKCETRHTSCLRGVGDASHILGLRELVG